MIAEDTGSNAMKSKAVILSALGTGVLLLFLAWLLEDDESKKVCSPVPAAVLASNPNLKRSYQIEKAKRECIEKIICRPDILMGSLPCEFTASDLKECEEFDPALGDYKAARRHLDAEVETCELSKRVGRHGETVYQWIGR